MRLETILAGVLKHPVVTSALGNAVTSDLVVANPYYRQLMEFAVNFSRTHRALPRGGDVQLWAEGLPEAQRSGVLEHYRRLMLEDIGGYTPEFLASEVIGDLQGFAAQTAQTRLNSGVPVTPQLLRNLTDAVSAIQAVSIDGLASVRDVRRWMVPEDQHRSIPTGITKLDRILGGGWRYGELGFVFADAGKGKTTLLLNFAKAAMLVGFKVLHITLELLEGPLIRRVYRSVTESDQKALRNDFEVVINGAEHWMRYAKGEYHVLYRRAYTVTPEDLRLLVDQYVHLHGDIDLLIVDYIDLMATSKETRGKRTDEQLAYTSHAIRGVGTEFDCGTLTATQSVRSASGAERLRMSDVASSYGIPRAADILLGYTATEDEEKVFQGRLCGLKFRENSGKGSEIPVYMNQDLMFVGDLDHPNTRVIMNRFGHSPVPAPAVDGVVDAGTGALVRA